MAVNRHQPNFSVRLNIFESTPRVRLPGDAPAESEVELVDGGQRCPLRDVGGPDGFMEFLGANLDPGHEQHRDMIGWYPRAVRQGSWRKVDHALRLSRNDGCQLRRKNVPAKRHGRVRCRFRSRVRGRNLP